MARCFPENLTACFRVRGHRIGIMRLAILMASMLVFSKANEDSLHLTMVTPRFYRVDYNQIILVCYRSSPDTDADLSFGRLPVHLPGAGIDSSTSFPDGTTSGEGDGQEFKKLPPWNANVTGLYYCEGSKGDQTTRVYSSVYRKDRGWYYPGKLPSTLEGSRHYPDRMEEDLLLTKTVNKGENVTLYVQSFYALRKKYASWRRIRDGVVTNLSDYDGMETITIPSSQAKHGDLYAVVDSRGFSLSDNKFTLIRLIVRGCVASKWGPPACDGVCDMCYNGGVCDDKTGYCICPPGFSGANCFTVCPTAAYSASSFGWDCEFRCGNHELIRMCSGSQFGLPDPFGISCINGYSGLTCSDGCTSGRFGAGCVQECHCLLPDLDCDRYTGVCHVGGCADGWSGTNCQIPDICQVGYYGINCLSKCHCLGDAACDKYTGYCSVGCASGFTCVSRQCEAGYFGEDCSKDCHCLDNAACDGITGSCPSGRCLGDQFQTDGTGICKFVLPVLSQPPDVSVNYTSAVVTWKPWGSHPMDSGDGPIMGYKIYHSNYSSSSSTRADYLAVISETPSSFRFEIESLQQLTAYNFSVAAVREGEGGEGPRSPVTTIRTQPRASHTDFLDTKDSLHLTMATHFFHRAGESNIIRLACYRSSPNTDADLSFGRLPVHLPGAGIDSSTSFPDGTTSGEFDGLKFTQLPINNVNATGLYYCEGSKGGQTTRVYSSVYSNNGWYYPGRWNALLLTKTINTGENATLSVQNRRESTSHASWRRISDGVATILTDYDEMGTITIPASQAKHGDVYVVVSSRYSLSDNKFSLFRLIVRGCVASKWGPPACDGVCDLCYNGGVCDDETGDCICPPGFMGPNCLTVCPIGSFGWDCEYRCGSDQLNSCDFSQFGLPDPFGISCINGHRGYECRYLCSSGSFGAGCLQECHCLSANECNRYTGVCTNRSCAEGWSGTNCQIPDTCHVGYYGLNCLSKCHCLDDTACDKYTGYCNVGCAPGFTCVSWQCEAGYFGGDCSKECHCLDDATCDGITGFCPSKKCIAPFQTDGTGICQSVPPVLSQPPEVRVKSTSAIVTWKAWGSHPLDAGDGPIVGYKIYHSNYSSISLTRADYISAIYQPPNSFSFDFESLQQLTVYNFSVAAVREGEGGEGPRSPVTTIRTQPQDTTQDRVPA